MIPITANNRKEILTTEEMDVLQEVMNIGFGSAAADLADVIDLYVILSVPVIRILKTGELLDYIRKEIIDHQDISIIEQNFRAKFKGVALVVFPSGAGKGLLTLMGKREEIRLESDPIGTLEKEILIEIGNILVGACVGKVAELLGDVASYQPPRVLIGNLTDTHISEAAFNPQDVVIVLQTVFHFSGRHVSGYLFLITGHGSINRLKQALHNFMRQFEC
jgi:chemotaxis protein CheC